MFTLELNGVIYSREDIISRSFAGDLQEQERKILEFCSSWLNEETKTYTIHTSGSTGAPKPITFTAEQMSASARMTQKALGLKENDRALVCLNTEYIAGRMMLVRGMEIGMSLSVIPPVSNPFQNISADEKFDFTAMVPLQIETILKESPEKITVFNNMRAIIIGGAPVSYSLEERIRKIAAPVYLTFGMTETISHIALRRLNGKDRQEYFEALESVSLSLDTRGCLMIDSPLTQDAVVSNDLVELIDEKKFLWKGRIDQVINSGGIKIFPEAVESKVAKVFHELGYDVNYFVTGLPDEKLGQKISIMVEEEKLYEEDKERLRTRLLSKEWGYESPRACYFIKKFSFTSTGKINRIETLKLLKKDY